MLRIILLPKSEREKTMKKSTVFSNGLIWFGAAISIAEILTGTFVADMGVRDGLLTIILGHLIGCALLFAAGFIGAKMKKSAMETTKLSFGKGGSYLFAILNVFQLVGWTAIMINQGANAANAIYAIGTPWWSVIIGVLIGIWILIGIKNLGIVNTVVMTALFALTIMLSVSIFKNPVFGENAGAMSFGSALELSVAMPVSWLPVIADYTSGAEEKPTKTVLVSVITYFFASCWMYAIGFFAAMFTGLYEIAPIIQTIGIGLIGLIIVVASTTTTTFLDAYSAGVSSVTLSKKLSAKWVGIITCVIGILLSIFAESFLGNLEGFLYIIAGVFSPMIAIMIADFFILKNNWSEKKVCVSNLVIWAMGFVAYHLCYRLDGGSEYNFPIPFGYTLPVVVGVIIVTVIVGKIKQKVLN